MTDGTPARRTTILYLLALLLACLVVVGGVLSVRAHGERDGGELSAPSVAEQERYGDALAAAAATATALVNIDYRDTQASFDAVAATATGTFLEQYRASSDSLVELVTEFESVMTGEVVTSAVSSLDDDGATVLVATTGDVSNAQTGGKPQLRNFRILVTLVRDDDAWLTDDLDFVG